MSIHRLPRMRKNRNWTDEELKKALEIVDDGMSMKRVAEENNIPYSSFCGWCYGRTRSQDQGLKGVLNPTVFQMCDRGLRLSPIQLKMKVYETHIFN
jgi:hypothetical protein